MMHPRKGEFFSSRVRYISLNQIRPNPCLLYTSPSPRD